MPDAAKGCYAGATLFGRLDVKSATNRFTRHSMSTGEVFFHLYR
jgi:hypothetical protein